MIFSELEQELGKRWRGEITGIPVLIKSNRMKDMLLSFDEGERILLTGGTGAAKTSFKIRLLLDIVEWCHKNNKEVTVLSNEVELPNIEIYIKVLQRYLFLHLGKTYTRDRLLNKSNSKVYDVEMEQDIKKVKPYIDIFNKYVRIVNIATPEQWAAYVYEVLNDQYHIEGKGASRVVKGKKNTEKQFFIMTDTISALESNFNNTQQGSIKEWSQKYSNKEFAMKYRAIILNVQQLDVASQKAQFTGRGERVFEKHIPSSEDLALVKTTPQDHSLVLGMLSPHRFHIKSIEDSDGNTYDVTLFKDKLIMLYTLKSNFGIIGQSVALYFDANTLEFEEIPSPNEKTLYDEFLRKKKISRQGRVTQDAFSEVRKQLNIT